MEANSEWLYPIQDCVPIGLAQKKALNPGAYYFLAYVANPIEFLGSNAKYKCLFTAFSYVPSLNPPPRLLLENGTKLGLATGERDVGRKEGRRGA